MTVLEEELARMSPDLGAIEAYRKKEADYKNRAQELESATGQRDEVSHFHLLVKQQNEFSLVLPYLSTLSLCKNTAL